MRTLDLDTESENTFAGCQTLCHGGAVTILYSERLFDEMAADEIQRVLASPASAG